MMQTTNRGAASHSRGVSQGVSPPHVHGAPQLAQPRTLQAAHKSSTRSRRPIVVRASEGSGPMHAFRKVVEKIGTRITSVLEKGDWTPADIPSQKGKVAVVTGANSGMGYASALKLAESGAKVIMVSRDLQRGLEAAEKMRAEAGAGSPPLQLEVLQCDLRHLKDVAKLSEEIKKRTDRIDIFIAMAGVFYPGPYDKTEDGIEQTLAINYYSHALLTLGLLPVIRSTPQSRIVFMASFGEVLGILDWDNLKGDKFDDSGFIPYGTSKLYKLCFARELARRVPDVDIFAVHPGLTYSPLHIKSDASYPLNAFIKPNTVWLGQSWKRGAYSTLYAATEPSLTGKHWGFFAPNLLGLWHTTERTPVSWRTVYNPVTTWRLWETTVQILRDIVGPAMPKDIPPHPDAPVEAPVEAVVSKR